MSAVLESRQCKRGCCHNPFQVCSRQYTCRCHASRAGSTAEARARLEDYIDSLGDE